MNSRLITILSLIIIAALSRLLPHLPNFTPLTAIALFAGATLANRYLSMFIPILIMLLSDAFMGFNGWHFMEQVVTVYGTYLVINLMGAAMQKNSGLLRVGALTFTSSVLFFITTNFAVWMGGFFHTPALYPMNSFGLTECYIAAIPFFKNALAGDIFYSAVLFGSYYLLRINVPVLERET